jgi:hypothetical protein
MQTAERWKVAIMLSNFVAYNPRSSLYGRPIQIDACQVFLLKMIMFHHNGFTERNFCHEFASPTLAN